jgi:acetolactate synthase regulatory subunit
LTGRFFFSSIPDVHDGEFDMEMSVPQSAPDCDEIGSSRDPGPSTSPLERTVVVHSSVVASMIGVERVFSLLRQRRVDLRQLALAPVGPGRWHVTYSIVATPAESEVLRKRLDRIIDVIDVDDVHGLERKASR